MSLTERNTDPTSIHPRQGKTCVHQKASLRMCRAALFTTADNWDSPGFHQHLAFVHRPGNGDTTTWANLTTLLQAKGTSLREHTRHLFEVGQAKLNHRTQTQNAACLLGGGEQAGRGGGGGMKEPSGVTVNPDRSSGCTDGCIVQTRNVYSRPHIRLHVNASSNSSY